MKKKNAIPEYVIEELIPRFRGIDTPTIANVKCDFLNIDGNFIMSKTSKPDYDELHLNANDTMFGGYDIKLCSDKTYDFNKKEFEGWENNQYDEVDGMLTSYHHSISTGTTYVTFAGFGRHFRINVLRKGFGIDIKKNYKFDKSKFKRNDVFKIMIKYKFKKVDERYGIVLSVNDKTLKLKLSIGFDPDDDYRPMNYDIKIDDIVNGKVTLERVEL